LYGSPPEDVTPSGVTIRDVQHAGPPARTHLTRREREILRALLDGCTNREIAQRFGTTEQTVKNQLTTLFDKIGVSSRLELVLAALHRALIDQPAD